jgi:hypothetical protein
MTARPSGKPCRQGASSPASLRAEAGRCHIPMTRRSTRSATRSRTSSPNSRTGGASQPVTTDARIPSSQAYASPRPSSSGFDLTSPDPSEKQQKKGPQLRTLQIDREILWLQVVSDVGSTVELRSPASNFRLFKNWADAKVVKFMP